MDRNEAPSSDEVVHVTIRGVDVRFDATASDGRPPPDTADGYPDDVFEDMFAEIREDDVFFEIGASTGVFSCVVGRKYPGIDVVCFEPHPRTREHLERNLRLNGIDATVMDCAISDAEGTMAFDIRDETHEGRGDVRRTEGEIEAPVRTLDGVVGDDVPSPTVILADIVGEESALLDGGSATFSSPTTRVAYIVTHDRPLERRGSSKRAIEDRLRADGFDTVEHLRENLLKATKSGPTG